MPISVAVLATIIFAAMVAGNSVVATPAEAGTRYDTISRGEFNRYPVGGGDIMEVTYKADGKAAQVYVDQGWAVWLFGTPPDYFFHIYWSLDGRTNWRYIQSATIYPWGATYGLPVTGGYYKFVIKGYEKYGSTPNGIGLKIS